MEGEAAGRRSIGGPLLRLRVLGPTRVEVDGRDVDVWPRPAARRLLVVLALSPRHHRRRDELVDMLFEHLAPDAGARALSKALSQARSVLDPASSVGGSLLVGDRVGIRLRPDVQVKVDLLDAIASLGAALDLADAADRRAAVRSSLAEHDGEPLADDLDEPWAADHRDELVALRDRAVHHLAEAPTPRPLIQAGPARAVAPLLGRDEDLATVVDCLTGTAPAVVTVSGPVGVGKSLLLQHARAALADRGWLTVAAAATPADRRLPLVALRQALRRLVATLPDGVAPAAAGPTLRQLLAGRADDRTSVTRGDLAALAADVEQLLATSSAHRGAPTALFLDDLHWADEGTLDVVRRLAATTVGEGAASWALALGWRTDEAMTSAPDLPSSSSVVVLGPVDDDAARRLTRQHGDGLDDEAIEAIVRRAAGNPFFVVELARMSRGPQPVTGAATAPALGRLADVVRDRLSTVSAAAGRLVALVAVAGQDATNDRVRAAAAALGLAGDEEHLLDAVDELVAADLLEATADGIRVRHPLLAEVTVADLAPLRLARLHAAIADAIALEPGSEGVLAEARHRIAAHDATRERALAAGAVRSALAAGHLARATGDAVVAIDLLGGALALGVDLAGVDADEVGPALAEGRLALGRLHIEAGRSTEAEAVLTPLLHDATLPRARARAWLAWAHGAYAAGDMAAAAEIYREGLAAVGDDVLGRAVLESALGWTRVRLGDLDAREQLRNAALVLEEAGDWEAAATALDRWGASLNPNDIDTAGAREALPILDRALAAARRTHEATDLAVIQMHRAPSLEAVGRPDDADKALEESFAIARSTDAAYHEAVAHWTAAVLHDGRGEVEVALAHRDAEAAILERIGNRLNLAICQHHRAELLRRSGRDDDARRAQRAAEDAEAGADGDRQLASVREA